MRGKTPKEIAVMAEGGKRLGQILSELLADAKQTVRLEELEAKADKRIQELGGLPSFKTVKNYRWATCLCVNDVVVHGVPSTYALKHGDVLTVDVGMIYGGLHTDTAWTIVIGVNDGSEQYNERERFLTAGRLALREAFGQAIAGNRVGHISMAISAAVRKAGYSIVRSLVGHGVGKNLHEDPQIPGMLVQPLERTPLLVKNMTIAIEVIYAQGDGQVSYDTQDGWSIVTKDGSLSAVFEHTIAITSGKPFVLTELAE